MGNIIRISGVILLIILIHSCSKEKALVPIITTADISDITQTTAICGGNITSDESTTITARGVCWSTNFNPTTEDNKTQDGVGSSSFISNVTGLESGTKYYVRAYATNVAGTGYGSELSFTTLLSPAQLELAQIQNYLNDNPDLDFQLQASGLYYLEVVAGIGPSPATNDSVYVYYTGKYLDGTIIGSNVFTGITFGFRANIGETIEGFDQGIMMMKEGGKSKFLFPSNLAYGDEGNAWIPGYTPLIWDVELVKIVKK